MKERALIKRCCHVCKGKGHVLVPAAEAEFMDMADDLERAFRKRPPKATVMWRALDTTVAHAWSVSALGSDYLFPACERLRGKLGPTVTARVALDLAGTTGSRRCKLCERCLRK